MWSELMSCVLVHEISDICNVGLGADYMIRSMSNSLSKHIMLMLWGPGADFVYKPVSSSNASIT